MKVWRIDAVTKKVHPPWEDKLLQQEVNIQEQVTNLDHRPNSDWIITHTKPSLRHLKRQAIFTTEPLQRQRKA